MFSTVGVFFSISENLQAVPAVYSLQVILLFGAWFFCLLRLWLCYFFYEIPQNFNIKHNKATI